MHYSKITDTLPQGAVLFQNIYLTLHAVAVAIDIADRIIDITDYLRTLEDIDLVPHCETRGHDCLACGLDALEGTRVAETEIDCVFGHLNHLFLNGTMTLPRQ